MAGRWIATNSPNERTGVGFVPATTGFFGNGDKGDMVEHDCQPGGSGSYRCGCGRTWKWSEGSGFITWGTAKAGRR